MAETLGVASTALAKRDKKAAGSEHELSGEDVLPGFQLDFRKLQQVVI